MRKRRRVSHRVKTPKPAQKLAPSGLAIPIAPHPHHSGRNVRGCFTVENSEQRTHSAYSLNRWRELAPLIAEQRNGLLAQKGFTSADVPPSLAIIIDALIEADLMRSAFFQFITTTGGPLSVKGRTRRAVEGWSKACDRCAKLAGMVGLERTPKEPPSIADWLAESGDGENNEAHDGNGGDDEREHESNDEPNNNSEEHHAEDTSTGDRDTDDDGSTDD